MFTDKTTEKAQGRMDVVENDEGAAGTAGEIFFHR
jgi:hypothetical protein